MTDCIVDVIIELDDSCVTGIEIFEEDTILDVETIVDRIIEFDVDCDCLLNVDIPKEDVEILVIEWVATGPQGPPGPPGQVQGFQYSFSESTIWTINHNLGFYPTVALYTVGGLEMIGQIQHISNKIVQITFVSPIAGFARLI